MALAQLDWIGGGDGGGEETYKLHSILVKTGNNTYTATDFTTIHKIKWSAEYKNTWGQYYAYGEWNDVDGAWSSMGANWGVISASGNQFVFSWDTTDLYTAALAIYGE